jgi:hypothetical protein
MESTLIFFFLSIYLISWNIASCHEQCRDSFWDMIILYFEVVHVFKYIYSDKQVQLIAGLIIFKNNF